MKKPLLKPLFLALALLAPACGGSGPDIAKDPVAALEQGNKAASSKDYDTAERAYAAVAENPAAEPALRKEALLGLGETQAAVGKGEAASSTFDRLQKEFGDQLDLRSAKRMVDVFLKSHDAEKARQELHWLAGKFDSPAGKAVVATLQKAVQALASGDESALAELGYAGD
ncbi:MAG: hypothetical protein ACE5H3_10165 [Planctomycetota bacterium]